MRPIKVSDDAYHQCMSTGDDPKGPNEGDERRVITSVKIEMTAEAGSDDDLRWLQFFHSQEPFEIKLPHKYSRGTRVTSSSCRLRRCRGTPRAPAGSTP
jgi:hypothetical protein